MSNTLHGILKDLTHRFTETGIDGAARDAKLTIQHALRCDAAALVADGERVVSEDEILCIEAFAQRRLSREPMSHILGYKDFWKDRFVVSPDVLTPRPDSETLIEAVLRAKPDRDTPYRILDLGTGSGCLLLSLLREYPNATGIGIDRSELALKVAKQNAGKLRLSGRTFFTVSDWMQTLQSEYDMIISNPPYIEREEINVLEPEVREYEPMAALSGGDDGLDAYRQILSHVPRYVRAGGLCAVELGAGQASAVSALAERQGMAVVEVADDLAGIPRALVLKQNDEQRNEHAS